MPDPAALEETDPDVLAAYAAGDVVVQRMKAAEARVKELEAIPPVNCDAAVKAALDAYKGSLAAVPFP